MADTKFLYEHLSDKMRAYRLQYADVPNYITENIKYNLFDWQKKALENFLDYQQVKVLENPNTATHLLFNMATGTGKTLVMASLMLYYYKQGYRHFLFFVNQNNIVGKTENNLLDPTHNKYLFKDPIVIEDKTVSIHKVETFSENPEDIEIIFTSIHKLHNAVYQVKENAIFLEDLQKKDIVMLADEAHHLNSDTKTKVGEQTTLEIIAQLKSGANAKEVEKSWEHTVTNLLLQKGNKNSTAFNRNVLLEFTATLPKIATVVKKYEDKIVYKFELKDFLKAGYTKEINLVSSSFDDNQSIEVIASGGTAPYEYRLENRPWQDSPIFNNITGCFYVVFVREKTACNNQLATSVRLINHPVFFTPNNDGFNDIWKIKGVEEKSEAQITIYDRYGRIINTHKPNSNGDGWDGLYNGRKMPSTNYWFTIEYLDTENIPRVYRSHFSLNR